MLRCKKRAGRESSERVAVYKKPGLGCWVDAQLAPFSEQFLLDLKDPKYKLQVWNGTALTQVELRKQLLEDVEKYSSPDFPGFVKEREADGIVYERNPSLEQDGNALPGEVEKQHSHYGDLGSAFASVEVGSDMSGHTWPCLSTRPPVLRFFRLTGDLQIPGDLAVAMLADAQKIGYKDFALATVQFFHTFPDEQSFMA